MLPPGNLHCTRRNSPKSWAGVSQSRKRGPRFRKHWISHWWEKRRQPRFIGGAKPGVRLPRGMEIEPSTITVLWLVPALKAGPLSAAADLIAAIGLGDGMFAPSVATVASVTLNCSPPNALVAVSALRKKLAMAVCISVCSALARVAGETEKVTAPNCI